MHISDWSSDFGSSDLGIIQSDTAALISATGKREAPRSSRRSTATRSLRRALARLRGDHCLRSEHVDLAFAREKRLDHGAGGGVENDCRPFALERNGLDRIGPFDQRRPVDLALRRINLRSEEHTSELQSLMRISYA